MLGLLDVKYDNMISLFLEDIPVIPDLEDVQEEDMMTQIAAPPRCVIDMFHLEPFPISGVLCEKNSPQASTYAQSSVLSTFTPEEFENGNKCFLSTLCRRILKSNIHRPFWICV